MVEHTKSEPSDLHPEESPIFRKAIAMAIDQLSPGFATELRRMIPADKSKDYYLGMFAAMAICKSFHDEGRLELISPILAVYADHIETNFME